MKSNFKLESVIESLGYNPKYSPKVDKKSILNKLSSGEISAEEAVKLLKEWQKWKEHIENTKMAKFEVPSIKKFEFLANLEYAYVALYGTKLPFKCITYEFNDRVKI